MTASSGPARKPTPRAALPADASRADAAGQDTRRRTTAPKDAGPKHAAPPNAPTKGAAASKPTAKITTVKDVPAAPPASARSDARSAAVETSASDLAKPGGEPSIGQLVSDATTHLSNLVHSEIELAKLELRSTVKNAGTGAGLFGAAAVVLIFSLTFGFFALAEGIAALGLDRWLAFLIVFALQLIFVGLCVYIGVKKVKRVKAPTRTIKSTRETVDYLKKSRG